MIHTQKSEIQMHIDVVYDQGDFRLCPCGTWWYEDEKCDYGKECGCAEDWMDPKSESESE